jgi:hypothetical protein
MAAPRSYIWQKFVIFLKIRQKALSGVLAGAS